MSLLTICQSAADRIGLVRPSQVIGASDHLVRNMLSLIQQEGSELAIRHNWQALIKEQTWTAAASETQTGILPSDFSRFVPGTFYNRGRTRMVMGPLTPQEYQDYKARLATIVYDAFRLRGSTILLLPTPNGVDTYAFEYVSNWWAGASGDTEPSKSDLTADDDVLFFDEELVTLGAVWRYKRSRGLDYAEEMQAYEHRLLQLTARDGGKRTLNMGSSVDRRIPRAPQAPDGNWNL